MLRNPPPQNPRPTRIIHHRPTPLFILSLSKDDAPPKPHSRQETNYATMHHKRTETGAKEQAMPPATRVRAFLLVFTTLFLIALLLSIAAEFSNAKWIQTAASIGDRLESLTVIAIAATFILVEGVPMLAHWIRQAEIKEAREEGRAEGRLEGQAEWQAIGRAEGRLEGQAEGRLEGQAEGRLEGQAEGRLEGQAEGRLEGQAEGRLEGQAEWQAVGRALEREAWQQWRRSLEAWEQRRTEAENAGQRFNEPLPKPPTDD